MTTNDADLVLPHTDGEYRVDRIKATRRRILEALVNEVERQGVSVMPQDVLIAMGQRVTKDGGWWMRYNLNILADACYIEKIDRGGRVTWWAEREWALGEI